MKRWQWYKLTDGSIAVYYDNNLCWELEGLQGYSDREISLAVKEFIMANQHMMHDD